MRRVHKRVMVIVSPALARSVSRSARRAAFGLVALVLASCAPVSAYQRGALANPTMAPTDLAGPAEEHTRAVQEGAIGGAFGAGGGCGCN